MKILGSVFLLFFICSGWFWRIQYHQKWYESLPDCPCRDPDWLGTKVNDGWALDAGDIEKYHKAAHRCFRSYPYVLTAAGKSGQQCCYDKQGFLIKSGSGAGTPDKVSTCDGEDEQGRMKFRIMGLTGHYLNDVRPFEKAGNSANGWKTYHKEWVPNQGKNCD